jgi:hypothetical protein
VQLLYECSQGKYGGLKQSEAWKTALEKDQRDSKHASRKGLNNNNQWVFKFSSFSAVEPHSDRLKVHSRREIVQVMSLYCLGVSEHESQTECAHLSGRLLFSD